SGWRRKDSGHIHIVNPNVKWGKINHHSKSESVVLSFCHCNLFVELNPVIPNIFYFSNKQLLVNGSHCERVGTIVSFKEVNSELLIVVDVQSAILNNYSCIRTVPVLEVNNDRTSSRWSCKLL